MIRRVRMRTGAGAAVAHLERSHWVQLAAFRMAASALLSCWRMVWRLAKAADILGVIMWRLRCFLHLILRVYLRLFEP